MKKCLLSILVMLYMTRLWAYDCKVNNICYNLHTNNKTATVTYSGYPYNNDYTGHYGGNGLYGVDVLIPSTITYNDVEYTVTAISDYAFYDCESSIRMASVTIPPTVTSIGKLAFYNCIYLKSIVIPPSVTSIGGSAFSGCSSLTSITISNSVTTIGSSAFADTPWFNNKPDGLVYAGKVAYKYKGATPDNTSIVIEEGTVSISDYAFINCSGLTSVTIPTSVTSIGSSVFSETGIYANSPNGVFYVDKWVCGYKGTMPSNTTIVLEEGTVGIASIAFYGNSNLTSLTIPASVTSIGEDAFYRCSSLTSVKVESETPVPILQNTFSNYANATLYVPYGSKDVYQTTLYWKNFGAIVELPNPNAITVGSTGYATFCSPNAMDFTDVNGIKAYIASGFEPSTGTLVLTRAIKVPAGEGLYIVGTPGTYNVPETVTDMVYSNLLKGVTTATTISPTDGSNTNFILANGNYGVGFYTLSEAGEIAAGKAYLQLPTASVSNVKAINFTFGDDSETGISETKEVGEVKAVYNLQGQRVSQPKHGLYIINGKKVIIK